MNHDCHGATDETHGTPLASQASDTGLVVSGVPATRTMFTLSSRMSWFATVAASASVDWLSLRMIWTSYFLPATVMPFFPKYEFIVPITNESAWPNSASDPVSGVT